MDGGTNYQVRIFLFWGPGPQSFSVIFYAPSIMHILLYYWLFYYVEIIFIDHNDVFPPYAVIDIKYAC